MVPKILAILGPKGGIGKSTLAEGLLVAMRLSGVRAVGVDLDRQGSFAAWGADRGAAGIEPAVQVVASGLRDWRAALERATDAGAGLVIFDTGPGLPDEDDRVAFGRLGQAADLVLVPSLAEEPTARMLVGVADGLRLLGCRVLFVLNKVDPRRRSTRECRAYLAEHGEVSPVEVPAREDIHLATSGGATAAEDPRLGGHEAMLRLRDEVARRLGLPA